MKTTDRQILHIALPSIVSNITVPLLGLIDVSIVGHLGAASYIGAIAVGGMLFNMIYWLFGFLRMGTGGLTAQAYGRHDLQEATRILLRSLSISLLLALALLILQFPIRSLAFIFMDTSEEVENWPRSISISASGELRPRWDSTALPAGTSACRTPVSRCSSPSPRILSTLPPVYFSSSPSA